MGLSYELADTTYQTQASQAVTACARLDIYSFEQFFNCHLVVSSHAFQDA